MVCLDIAAKTGQRLLFCGANAASWSIAQFEQVADFACAHGVDSLLVKVGESGWWYGGPQGVANLANAIIARGVGFIPYIYSNGGASLATDISMLRILMQAFPSGVCVDMESQWNGQVAWAEQMCTALQSLPGVLMVTTWGDPDQQDWSGVLRALNPCVDVYIPQAYDNYLAGTTWVEFAADGASCIFPAVNMTNEDGPNNPVVIASTAHQRGDAGIVVWYADTAMQNPGLFDQVMNAFPRTIPTGDLTMLQLSSPMGQFFTQAPGNAWKCASKNTLLGNAMLDYWRKHEGEHGLPLTNEFGLSQYPGVTFQVCERAIQTYDPDKKLPGEVPPGAGQVYLLQIMSGLGQQLISKPLITNLQDQIASLQKQVQELQAQPTDVTALQQQIASYQQAVEVVYAAVEPLHK
jgi:hypothetical protein